MSAKPRRNFLKQSASFIVAISTGIWGCSKSETKQEIEMSELTAELEQVLSGRELDKKITALRLLEKKYGTENVRKEVGVILRKWVTNNWKNNAEEAGKNDIATYINILWDGFCKKDGLQFTMTEENGVTQMHCTYCPWAEKAKQLNATDWGYELFCMTDYYMIEGFNPDIQFERTKTLMQGNDCCDHSYRMKQI
ncbi:L-2-amino-thiazoline-4-carboxylic acid hydrolase [candidate division KSB1 bacterium]|nr:L-2-amino-thiazoline-4-carboxylic acid hydrolase [candidate division KSB1 bacterium]